MKELFTSMREGIMEGISIEKQMARRMADEQYRYSIYKKENTTKHVTNTTKNGKDK